MAATVALLLLPAPRSLAAGRGWTAALRLRQLRVIPWLTLILLGGGFALAQGIEASGLSRWMGERLSELARYPRLVQFVGVCLVTVFFGAIASNVATTSVMMVVLMSAEVSGVLPLMATATLAASCDFMLPAGTPPNAIVFGSGYLTIPRMARTGFFLDLAAALLVALWGWVGISRILA
jgi:sodium-dependent dicarboxylate transporter 2/3/5